jgi:hypothetical protein
MAHKPFKLQPAVITAAALTIGSTAGSLAQTFAAHLGYTQHGIGHLATAVTALWTLDKLNKLIDDTDN